MINDNSMIHIHKNSADSKRESNKYYCVAENCDFMDDKGYPQKKSDSREVTAKKIIKQDGSYQYLIRLDTNGKLYNPISIYDDNVSKRPYRNNDRFQNVNLKTFEYYINFLKTKNISWFNNAEREAE